MSTISSGLMTALMMVLSSVFGVVAIDGVDALTEERFVPQEKLDRAILKITDVKSDTYPKFSNTKTRIQNVYAAGFPAAITSEADLTSHAVSNTLSPTKVKS